MTLFEPKMRTCKGWYTSDMSVYQYYDRSCRVMSSRVREYLNDWVRSYPIDSQPKLIADFKSKSRFEETFTELFMYQLFKLNDYEVDIPTLGDHQTPDLRVSRDQFSSCIIESTVINNESDREKTEREMRDRICQTLKNHIKPNKIFLIIGYMEIIGRQETPLRPVIKEIQSQIAEWEQMLDGNNDLSLGMLKKVIDGGYFQMSILPFIRDPDFSFNEIFISNGDSGAIWGTCDKAIKDTVRDKVRKYKSNLTTPFIVVINLLSVLYNDKHSIENVLYGYAPSIYEKKYSSRKIDGVFKPNSKAALSGVIIGTIYHGAPTKAKLRYYVNPYADRPYSLQGVLDEYALVDNDITQVVSQDKDFKQSFPTIYHWEDEPVYDLDQPSE